MNPKGGMLRTPFGTQRRVARSGIVPALDSKGNVVGYCVRWKGEVLPGCMGEEEAKATLNKLHDDLLKGDA